jgi:LCP family protein required for cell wall assembly
VLIAVLAVLALLVGGGVTAVWAYGRTLNGNVKRTDVFSKIPSSSRPTQAVTGAMNVLLLGSDSRDPASTADSRSDTIMLLHLDADHKHAYVISIPRDTWVSIPGNDDAKINSAYAYGGMPLAVQTVENYTGVRIDHTVLIDFAGFQQVVDALGGIDMYVEQTITSIFPPYRVFNQGNQHFTGAQALDYVRQRYQFTDGDFTREKHQQEFLKALLDKAASGGMLTNPARLNSFLQAVTKSVTVDQDFDLVGMALQLSNLRSNDITFLTSPSAGTGWEGDQSVVEPDVPAAKALYAAVANDTVASYLAAKSPSPAPSPSG